jgi:hypothetical protein
MAAKSLKRHACFLHDILNFQNTDTNTHPLTHTEIDRDRERIVYSLPTTWVLFYVLPGILVTNDEQV